MTCNADNPSNCNGGPIDTSAIHEQGISKKPATVAFLRHHSVAAEGVNNSNRVVYVTLADIDKNPETAERVVAAVSTDDGKTFRKAFPLNEDSCSNGEQDMPHAAFDYTTAPPTLWVVWRHQGTKLGSFGGCIRRFFLDVTGVLVPLDDARDVEGMDLEDITGSQGGLKVQAGDGVVTVVYSNTDHLFKCPDTGEKGIAWGSVSSFDYGHNWVDNDRILHTEHFRWCVLDDPTKKKPTPIIQNSLRAFDFVRAPSGAYYVALNDSADSIRLFMSPSAGAKGWHCSGLDPLCQQATIRTWFEWCPLTVTNPNDPQPVFTNWRRIVDDNDPCPIVSFRGSAGVAIFPSLGVDGDGKLSLTYYVGDATLPGTLNLRYAGLPNPQSSGINEQFAPSIAGPFGPPDGLKGIRETVVQPLGSYFGIAPRSSLTGAISEPGCEGNQAVIQPSFDVFPFWVQRSGTDPNVATTKVTLTP